MSPDALSPRGPESTSNRRAPGTHRAFTRLAASAVTALASSKQVWELRNKGAVIINTTRGRPAPPSPFRASTFLVLRVICVTIKQSYNRG